ncbi:L-histidine N(alpha)-methyltransferase (plasmid) [Streptomyces sp. NBC_00445]
MVIAVPEVSPPPRSRASMSIPPGSSPTPLQLTSPENLASAAIRGLSGHPKHIPAKWLYDAAGTALFVKITKEPEYYITSAEHSILAAARTAIADISGARALIELGTGSPERTRLLLEALSGTLTCYVPVDVSPTAISRTTAPTADLPAVTVSTIVADFTETLDHPPVDGPRLLTILGGTFGNLLPHERARCLHSVAGRLGPGDRLLLGVDLVQDPDVAVSAFDDAAGLTAQFNTNLLHRLNRELGGDFDVDAFDHVALWDSSNHCVEMRLRSCRAQTVALTRIDLMVPFAAGEDLRTKTSATFQRHTLARELTCCGLELTHWWPDQNNTYGLALAARPDDLTTAP